MKKPAKDPIREDRIDYEAIVDTYGPEERATGWYYYLKGKIRFSFQAKCIVAKLVSPLRKGETAEVRRLVPEDACAGDMLVLIRQQGRNVAVPLSQLAASSRTHRLVKLSATCITGSRKGISSKGELMATKKKAAASKKVGTVMHELKTGQLKSSSGQQVTNPKQAIAIGLSEARAEGDDVPPKPGTKKKAPTKKKK